jgi:hypothetical protein
MIAKHRFIVAACARCPLLGTLVLLATWSIGCSRSFDSPPSRTTPVPAAQPSVATPFKPADDAGSFDVGFLCYCRSSSPQGGAGRDDLFNNVLTALARPIAMTTVRPRSAWI